MKKAILTTLLLTAVVVGCDVNNAEDTISNGSYATTAPTIPAMSDEQIFLSVIYDEYPQYQYLGDAYFLKLGQLLCDSIDEGLTPVDLALMAMDMNIDAVLLGYVVGASTSTFCPWNNDFFQ